MTYLENFMRKMYEPPPNAQAGYRYTTPAFNVLHATSAVQTDEDALAYIRRVEEWFPHSKVMIVEKREAGTQEWKMIYRDEEQIGQLHVLLAEPVHMQSVEVPEVSAASDPSEADTESSLSVVTVPPVPHPPAP